MSNDGSSQDSNAAQEKNKIKPAAKTEAKPVEKNASSAKPDKSSAKPGKPAPNKAAATDKTGKSKSGGFMSFLALFLALAALAASALLWQQGNQSLQQVSNSQQKQLDRIGDTEAALSSITNQLGSLKANFDQQLSASQERQTLLQETITALQLDMGKDEQDGLWELTEVEYLLGIANNRLLLERDVSTAIAALTMADNKLREMADLSLIEVRHVISDEITSLRAVEEIDIVGISLALGSLQNNVGQMPLKGKVRQGPQQDIASVSDEQATDTDKWQQVLNDMGNSLKSLVTIRRIGDADAPMIPPDQHAYIEQNLRLKLETAQLALFRNDNQNFHNSLDTIREWVEKYFVSDAGPASSMLDTLEELDKITLDPPLPDVSTSLSMVHKLITQKASLAMRTPPGTETAPLKKNKQTTNENEQQATDVALADGTAAGNATESSEGEFPSLHSKNMKH